MFAGRPIRRISRARAALAGVAIIAAAVAVPLMLSGVSAAASKPAAGVIHIYVLNTSTSSSAPNHVLITGVISDHGTGKRGTFHLAKGTITANPSALNKKLNSSKNFSFYKASCSYSGKASAAVPIVSGTGAYAGIKGSVSATVMIAAQGSLLKNGKCNMANNAPTLAQDTIITASGKVTF